MRLTYLDRGKCQIVFAGDDPATVYKLPMALRYLPAVDAVRARTGRLNKRGLTARIRRVRLRMQLVTNPAAMRRSADILARLAHSAPGGSGRFFPETEVAELANAELQVGDRQFRYSGFALRQARVADFFDRKTPLDSFDWSELTGVVTGLWRQGVGMASVADTWGQKNWGRNAQGRVRLIDTSHLSEDCKQVEARIVPGANQDLQDKMIAQGVGSAEPVRAYFDTLARDLNPERLHALWRSDLPA